MLTHFSENLSTYRAAALCSVALCQACSNAPSPIAGDCSFMTNPTIIIDDVVLDVFSGREYDAEFYGTNGDDRILVRPIADVGTDLHLRVLVSGLSGNDVICVQNSPNIYDITVRGGDGDDTLYARDGQGVYSGGSGSDVFFTHTFIVDGSPPEPPFENRVPQYSPDYFGDEGDDYFISRAYSSVGIANGGEGNDYFFGRDLFPGVGGGIGTFDGGPGDDQIVLHEDRGSEIFGGDGNDTIVGNPNNPSSVINGFLSRGGRLFGGVGNDSISDARYADGGEGDDSITGTRQSDYLYGGAGEDTINGKEGDDNIGGGSCNLSNSYTADTDADNLYGEVGSDSFFTADLGSSDIKDYSSVQDDLKAKCPHIVE